MSILFISDLHLEDERPELTEAFIHFLDCKAKTAEALYILGDFFEAWIGDDFSTKTSQQVIAALKTLTGSGVPVYFNHGNRDFLLGQQFANQCGANLLPEITVISPYHTKLLLMHGDQLCLDDHEYQAFRTMVRSEDWQQAFLAKPLAERIEIAKHLRETSKAATRLKTMEITDITPQAADDALAQYECDYLIHGHTHRPAVHSLKDGKTRIVLGDWGLALWYLEWRPDDSYQLIQQAIT